MHAAQAQAADAPASNIPARIDIPIREVLLENGARLYSIPIKLGNTETEAGLDTGSTAFDVLYEAGGSRIGIKARPSTGDGPGGQLAPPQ
jgi:hypothetical protein